MNGLGRVAVTVIAVIAIVGLIAFARGEPNRGARERPLATHAEVRILVASLPTADGQAA
jgi:hypothetical protein